MMLSSPPGQHTWVQEPRDEVPMVLLPITLRNPVRNLFFSPLAVQSAWLQSPQREDVSIRNTPEVSLDLKLLLLPNHFGLLVPGDQEE